MLGDRSLLALSLKRDVHMEPRRLAMEGHPAQFEQESDIFEHDSIAQNDELIYL
jgi:hypothetical protein